MRKALHILLILASLAVMPISARAKEESDSVVTKKKSIVDRLPKPLRWIANNWSAYDPRYSTPSFYNWAASAKNTLSQEWLNMSTSEGMNIQMSSKLSSKIGLYLSYSFLEYGYSIDVMALKGTNRRNEFTLSINSNLVNVDLIRRRTGGDFRVNKLRVPSFDWETLDETTRDLLPTVRKLSYDNYISYDITGANINYFTNHKKYSNPAAFSNGAIQLRSVGSPIVGLGYTHQRVENYASDLTANTALANAFKEMDAHDQQQFVNDFNQKWGADIKTCDDWITYTDNMYDEDVDKFKLMMGDLYNNSLVRPTLFGESVEIDNEKLPLVSDNLAMLLYDFPSMTHIYDWHLQLGYAYNLVFSRRLMLGLSLVTSPGVKYVKYDNSANTASITADALSNAINQHFGIQMVEPDELRMNERHTSFGANLFGRASLVFNHNRWRAGINANANAFLFGNSDVAINNAYGSACFYVGYCFGRKKQYRYNGADRQAYITAALTNRQIEEMRDTMPASNISQGPSYLAEGGRTKYHRDRINFNIEGCDLVMGPDGTYGSFTIEDGLVTRGQDTEGRLKPGTVLPMDKDGDIDVEAGHKAGFLAANWWKSQIDERQTPLNWYPEMLHYALRGTLTMYVRSHTFGTKEPVKITIPDFYISHGTETKEFFLIGAKSFASHSSYSIIGHVGANGRKCRVYIESKRRGTHNNVYINRMKQSSLNWLQHVPDDRVISRISLPGTHDAGTASLPEGTLTSQAHTQNFSITEQLEDGIRCFDIRLKSNMKYGHTLTCRNGFDETLADMRRFLKENPSEFIIAMIGSDEGGKWSAEMKANFNRLRQQYSDLWVEGFDAQTTLGDVRGKILVIRRQEDCPFGKLLKFEDNKVFRYDCFHVEDVYKEHKTYKKIKIVGRHLRDAYENDDPTQWFVTFNSIAWDPRHHKPYYSAWGATNVLKPMNPSLRELIEEKSYSNMGMIFLDFYNDHGDKTQLVESIIQSNFRTDTQQDYIPSDE